METTTYIRRPFYVEVVEVTEGNFDAVAEWVDGVVGREHGKDFIRVQVHNAQNDRQTKAFVGDFILQGKAGFKVFTKSAFETSFMLAPQPKHPERSDRSPRSAGAKKNPKLQQRNRELLAKAARTTNENLS